ncbi:phage single-stranded DNA-binding protein [Vibrio vulnificus]|uniref:phage single-stranded DNA-binding protein n=1 Tax=Vibrio vulnificus TaxID=672 RepID=UPI0001F5BDE2|nr:phage single-stranded DNA-binding protein [Vibrio vulnificus]ADV88573.1 phage single-stranded DNA-binding protein, putative [Vibrio vulnificus MO6-24/O]
MAKQTTKRPLVTLPVGIAQFPWLNKPDTHYDKNGAYKTDLVVNPEDSDVKETVEKLEDILRDYWQNEKGGKGEMVDVLMEKDGKFFFRVKQSAFEYKGELVLPKPVFYDARGRRMVKEPAIYGGSEIALSVEVWPYSRTETVREGGKRVTIETHGLTLKPKAVQVISLAAKGEAGAPSADYYGFGAHDGGYEYDEDDAQHFPEDGADEQHDAADGSDDGNF